MKTPSWLRRRVRGRGVLASLGLASALALPGPALGDAVKNPTTAAGAKGAASATDEAALFGRVACTTEPRSRWISEEEIRRIFGVEKYVQVKFKISRYNCYEFYAIGREGGVVEAYYHPITGQLVRESRFGPGQGGTQ